MNLLERHYQELGTNFRAVWDFYIKFHTVFLVINLLGLGLTAQFIHLDHRKPMVWAFLFQNFISGITDLGIAAYSRHAAKHQRAVTSALQTENDPKRDLTFALSSAIPEQLAIWAGVANAAAHVFFSACWVAVMYLAA